MNQPQSQAARIIELAENAQGSFNDTEEVWSKRFPRKREDLDYIRSRIYAMDVERTLRSLAMSIILLTGSTRAQPASLTEIVWKAAMLVGIILSKKYEGLCDLVDPTADKDRWTVNNLEPYEFTASDRDTFLSLHFRLRYGYSELCKQVGGLQQYLNAPGAVITAYPIPIRRPTAVPRNDA